MLPKPNDGFAWVQAANGPALVCHALEPYAAHLFTTRPWALGSPTDGDPTAAWDDVARALGAAHAGWKGLAASVPLVTVDALSRHVGSQPADLVAAVGPSIGACCYEVGVDVLDAFRRGGFEEAARPRWFFRAPQPSARNPSMPGLPRPRRQDHWFFDGWAAARQQLEAAGIPAD